LNDAQQQVRVWRLLVRVRQLRIERRRRDLANARERLRQTLDELAARRAEVEQHAIQRAQILRLCGHGQRHGWLGRAMLHEHVKRTAVLEVALADAILKQEAALAEVQGASTLLQREMRGHEDAQARVQRLRSSQTDQAG
jgi:hypothetical protein